MGLVDIDMTTGFLMILTPTMQCLEGRVIDEISNAALEDNIDKLHSMSQLLLQYETIDAPQIDAIMEGREPPPPMGWGKSSGAGDDKGGDTRPLPPVGGPATQT